MAVYKIRINLNLAIRTRYVFAGLHHQPILSRVKYYRRL